MGCSKKDIIDGLSKEKKVEELIDNITKRDKKVLKEDLSQDIYLELLMKPDTLIEELYEKGELDFFIVKMITNNVYSKNSPYHYRYKRYENNKLPLNEWNDESD